MSGAMMESDSYGVIFDDEVCEAILSGAIIEDYFDTSSRFGGHCPT